MNFMRLVALAAMLGATLAPASAALDAGAVAPDFKTDASLGGKVFSFDLKEALAKGPVVLYFYPAAFTSGCTLEAHDFAERMSDAGKVLQIDGGVDLHVAERVEVLDGDV